MVRDAPAGSGVKHTTCLTLAGCLIWGWLGELHVLVHGMYAVRRSQVTPSTDKENLECL